jgi:tetratricopeptide (TPR) repeat protein
MFRPIVVAALAALLLASRTEEVPTAYSQALRAAAQSLDAGDHAKARHLIERAIERGAQSPEIWALRARWAEAVGNRDELVWSLHRELRLRIARKEPRSQIEPVRARLTEVDPIAAEFFQVKREFLERLQGVASQCEKDKRPHAAIRVHKEILALDPENAASADSIQRLASAPDPSLAPDAKPRDLFEGVAAEWIAEHDAKHREWNEHAVVKKTNYTTRTNAGYVTLIRASEAMEQMNAFYREFFNYGVDGQGVSPIELRIFASRDEYLKLGSGPPVEWSGGQFTGDAVETYVSGTGFEDMIGTLFHEAAHQFVSLATNASGWLNEGLASFFEGCRILANGTVLMNLPANHRLFPLAQRMEKGWMAAHDEGIDPKDPDKDPEKAPTFAIVLENKYGWGPPWYAPTWGVVYFLYNYQDPFDGRYVYRKAFRQFINSSGGRVGEGAIDNFREVVLAQPLPPYKDQGKPAVRPPAFADVALPKTMQELDDVWKQWTLQLRDEQLGTRQVRRDWLRWARFARDNGDLDVAKEHFEKGLESAPDDPELLYEFARFLEAGKNLDRAVKLALQAVRALEAAETPDAKRLRQLEELIAKCDPKRSSLERIHAELWSRTRSIVQRYEQEDLPLQVMEVSWHFATDLGVPGLLSAYERALRKSGRSIHLWELLYNERDLKGWNTAGQTAFLPEGSAMGAEMLPYQPDSFDFQILTSDRVTSGDYSLEAEIQAEPGETTFGGLVFGRKDATNFHAFVLFPGRKRPADGEGPQARTAGGGFVDLASFFGGNTKTWRHNPVDASQEEGRSSAGRWYKLRIDVAGGTVDCWLDSQLVSSQDFGSPDVLRGSFGLVMGRGKAKFREIRHRALVRRDPSAAIERALLLEKLKATGEPINGSYVGLLPPFPKVARWVQGERQAWEEGLGSPQLLVLWSIDQNEVVAIDAWLRELAEMHRAVGLQVVSVCSPNDEPKIVEYLSEHAFPGAVAVDRREGVGIGDTNKLYFTARFNLPRLLLLDVDGKVVWEGDPGISAGEPWVRGQETYLTVPLQELIAQRGIPAYKTWIGEWIGVGVPAMAKGEVSAAWPLLTEAAKLDPIFPAVADAQARAKALEQAWVEFPSAAERIAGQSRAPALAVLVEWAKALEKPIDKGKLATAKAQLDHASAKSWDKAKKACQAYRPRLIKDASLLEELVSKLTVLEGPFCEELITDLREAGERGPEAVAELIADLDQRPRAWLARDYFRW